ncbi:MAG TPA: AAA family ATPase, partial [Isosphaeraceae bacterium]|nr:AAA family ATPase [Isosphaeraceae bacterium]
MDEHGVSLPTTVIAVGNQKGGVAKTTNTVHIAAALGELGRKCLIIDLDMNQGATRHLGILSEAFLGSYEMLIGEEEPEDVVISGEDEGVDLPPNVHLISARRNLEKVDQALLQQNKFLITQ